MKSCLNVTEIIAYFKNNYVQTKKSFQKTFQPKRGASNYNALSTKFKGIFYTKVEKNFKRCKCAKTKGADLAHKRHMTMVV